MSKEEYIDRLLALDYERDAKLDAGVNPDKVFKQYRIAVSIVEHEYMKTLEAGNVC